MSKNNDPVDPRSDDEKTLFNVIWEEMNPLLIDSIGMEYAIHCADGLVEKILASGFSRQPSK